MPLHHLPPSLLPSPSFSLSSLDNFFNQSYPLVFHQELEETFNAAGVKLEVRNYAMGNNPPVPAAFCVANQLGLDIDVAVWEFGK